MVGIGTASPGAKLHIYTTGIANNLKLDNSGGAAITGLSLATTGTIKGYWALASHYNDFSTSAVPGDMVFRSEANNILFNVGAGIATMAINNGNVGIGTTGPTHTLTLGSTSTGIALYNTSDQTANYERVRIYHSGNTAIISSEFGGTGVQRPLALSSGGTSMVTINNAASGATITTPKILLGIGSSTVLYPVSIVSTLTSTSTVQNSFAVGPTISQSGTAGYTGLLINPTESSTGSGAKLLIDAQVGGTSKFKVDNGGQITAAGMVRTNNAVTVASNTATVPVTAALTTITNNAAATVTITIATTGAVYGQLVQVQFYDFSAATQTLAWTNTENSTIAAPTTSLGSTTVPLSVGFMYNSTTSKWRCIAVA